MSYIPGPVQCRKSVVSFVLLSAPFLSMLTGCATQELRTEIRRLDKSLSDTRALQSEQSEAISSMDLQIKSLSGRLEEIEYSQNKKIGSMVSRLDQDVNSIKKRLPPPSVVPVDQLEVDEVWGQSLTGEAATLFADGLALIREGRFKEALPSLENAVSQLEDTDKAGTALFWVGVAYEGLDDTRGSLRAYVELGSRYPKSQRAPSGFLRQAKILMRLGDSKAAELALKKLVADYPRTSEAASARDQLRNIR